MKIAAIYLILFGSVIFYYNFNNACTTKYKAAKTTFTEIYNQKAQLTQSFTGCVY